MLLQDLFEAKAPAKEVAIIFGRFNPPHKGHKGAWETAKKFGTWYVGTNKDTIGEKNPLPADVKIICMETLMPEIKEHLVICPTWTALAVYVYKKHGPDVDLKIVTDENDAKIHVPYLQKDNGKETKYGYYKFKSVEWKKAERTAEASKLRAAVLQNDKALFAKEFGASADTPIVINGKKIPFFKLVATYLLPYFKNKKVAEGLTDYPAPTVTNKGKTSAVPLGKKKPDQFGRNFKTSKPSKSGHQPHPLRGKLVGGI